MAALWLRLWLVTIPQRLVTIPKQKKMETNRKMSKHTPGPWTVAPLGMAMARRIMERQYAEKLTQ